jgi:hypothetical protein
MEAFQKITQEDKEQLKREHSNFNCKNTDEKLIVLNRCIERCKAAREGDFGFCGMDCMRCSYGITGHILYDVIKKYIKLSKPGPVEQ